MNGAVGSTDCVDLMLGCTVSVEMGMLKNGDAERAGNCEDCAVMLLGALECPGFALGTEVVAARIVGAVLGSWLVAYADGISVVLTVDCTAVGSGVRGNMSLLGEAVSLAGDAVLGTTSNDGSDVDGVVVMLESANEGEKLT